MEHGFLLGTLPVTQLPCEPVPVGLTLMSQACPPTFTAMTHAARTCLTLALSSFLPFVTHSLLKGPALFSQGTAAHTGTRDPADTAGRAEKVDMRA